MGMSGMPGMNPQMIQQLMQALAAQKGGQGMQPPAMPAGATSGPGAMQPPQGDGGGQIPQLGGNNTQLAGGKAIPQVPGVPMSAQPGYQKPRMAAHGVAAIPAAAIAITQKIHDSKVQKIRAQTNEWLAQQDNPQNKKVLDDAAKADPRLAKILEKKQADFAKAYHKAMADPSSPEAQGIQLAYKDQQTQESQQIKIQEDQQRMLDQQAQAQQRVALAQQERAKAGQLQKQTALAGTETEADKAKYEAQMARVTTQITARLKQTDMQTSKMIEATKLRIAGSIKVAGIRAAGTVRAAHERGNKIDTYIVQEYKALNQQLTELDRQSKDLQSHLDKTSHWYGDADDKAEVQQQLAQIEAQRGVLAQQFQMLQAKDQAFQSTQITTKTQVGTGTQSDPIVIP